MHNIKPWAQPGWGPGESRKRGLGEEAEQKRALGVRGKMISPFFHQLSLRQGQTPPPSSHTSAHLSTGRMAQTCAGLSLPYCCFVGTVAAPHVGTSCPAPLVHGCSDGTMCSPREAVAVLPQCSLQRWHRCANPGTPALTEFVPKALRSRLLWIAAGAGCQWQLQHGHQHCPELLARPQHPASPCQRAAPPENGVWLSPSSVVPARPLQSPLPAVQEGEQGRSGKPPTAWIQHGADGRTNSAGISVSHNLFALLTPTLNLFLPWSRTLLGKSNQETWKGFRVAGVLL